MEDEDRSNEYQVTGWKKGWGIHGREEMWAVIAITKWVNQTGEETTKAS